MRKRTKFGVAFVVTVASTAGGCGTISKNPPPPQPDTGGYPITENPPAPSLAVGSYDVIVSADTVTLLPRYSTDDVNCRPSGVETFPGIGECTDEGDAVYFPCGDASTNITEVSIDGVTAAPQTPTGLVALEVNANANSVLSIDGGYGPIGFPLHATGLPTPTITTMQVAAGYDVAWTTDLPPVSSVVDFTAGLAVRHCHVVTQSYSYVGDASSAIGVRVQPLLELEVHQTMYGEFRVWRGNGKYQSF